MAALLMFTRHYSFYWISKGKKIKIMVFLKSNRPDIMLQ